MIRPAIVHYYNPITESISLSLIVGERFRAVWDASGDVPVLRLSQSELSFLSQIPVRDRELATALLSRVFNIPFPHMCVMFGHIPHTCITSLRFDRNPGALAMPLLEYSVDARHLSVFREGMTGSVERAQS